MGWEGTVFGEIKLNDLSEKSMLDSAVLSQFQPQSILHYKYIPRTGCPGEADVEYPTVSPPPSASSSTVESRLFTRSATLRFRAYGFQELPTLHHIVQKLAGIDVTNIAGATMVIARGASDYSNQRVIHV